MKKTLAMLMLLCCLTAGVLLAPPGALADSPRDIALSYDLATQVLTVTITHKSTFTGLHYIKQVSISRNGEPAEKKEYSSQTGKVTFAYAYAVPAAAGDILEVTAFCNISGKKTATLTVGAGKP
ncbi:MAG: hypothetical protein GXY72_13510 [Deltaproteobacteria bacterium]|nr:hypothetical protein [Syntrophaceae bacterium]NLX53107.1 hypothetical protein [Deltaproteobacteria bacterium]